MAGDPAAPRHRPRPIHPGTRAVLGGSRHARRQRRPPAHVTGLQQPVHDTQRWTTWPSRRRLVPVGCRLADRSLDPTVQYRIGGCRIDFVLSAPDGRRLAIECDGESHRGPDGSSDVLDRQALLERVGNCVFVRLRASRFHRDPDAAMRARHRLLHR